MRDWIKVFAVAVVMCGGVAYSADKPAADAQAGEVKPKTGAIKGAFVKVEGVTVFVKDKNGIEVKFVTDDKTEVTINGEAGKKITDLKDGLWIYATPAEGTVTKIIANIPKPKKHKNPAPAAGN